MERDLIRRKIGQGKIRQAIELWKEQDINNHAKSFLELQLKRWSSLQKEVNDGCLTLEKKMPEENKIARALLNELDRIDQVLPGNSSDPIAGDHPGASCLIGITVTATITGVLIYYKLFYLVIIGIAGLIILWRILEDD